MTGSVALKARHGRTAFTLVEMLVAIAVLALLIVLVSQLTNSATATITSSSKRMDSDTAARLVFNRMAVDFSRMPKRIDLDYSFVKQTGSDLISFFCETVGFYGKTNNPPSYTRRAPFSLVAYRTINSAAASGQPVVRFERLAAGLGWEPGGTGEDAYNSVVFLPMKIVGSPGLYGTNDDLYSPSATSSIDFKHISEQVFRFEYCFLLKDGSLSVNSWMAPHTTTTISDVAAIVVALAVLDNRSRVVVGDLERLAGAFPDALNGQDIHSLWNPVLSSLSSPPAGVVKSAALQTRIYQRYFYLPD